MHGLRISFIFLLFFIFSCHSESLFSKLYQDSVRPLYGSIRIRDAILKRRLLPLPSRWAGREDHLIQNLHAFSGYVNKKWKGNKNELNKKHRLFQTNKIHSNPDAAKRWQVGREHFQGSNLSNQSNQESHIRKLHRESQQDPNPVQAQLSGGFPCMIPKLVNQNEIGKSLPIPYPNPCQPDPERQCEFIYEKYPVKEKFIQCDKSGKAILKSCPSNSQWDNTVKSCLYSYASSNISCAIPSWDNPNETGSKLEGFYKNPCVADRKRPCNYIYQVYKLDKKKFIRCDRSGNAIVKSCPTSVKWDEKSKRCSLKTTMAMTSTEKSTESITTTYKVPSTTEMATKQTDTITTEEGTIATSLEATTIETTSLFTTTIQGSTKQSIITTETQTTLPTSISAVDTSNSAKMSSIYMTTETMLPCMVPFWDDQNDNGKELEHYLINPCAQRPNGHCKFSYKLYYLDPHKFIQCDIFGNARVKSCPASFIWDNTFQQCIPETLITTELPCLIPSWDDQNDNGTELKHYLLNPCKPQPNGHCKFTYRLYYLDPHKFIQCDRSGNARVKSCPASFTWDKDINQCIPETLITTELPCLIPSWDDQNDNGTELENYLLNPCKPQPNGHCEFTYKLYYLDLHKFIQCDRFGNARVKSCPASFTWDKDINQCISETLITTELPCLIPSWDDQNDNGTELENYLLNPCKPQPNGHCEFTYKLYYLDLHKFIQCDRFGNARVKSCPASFTWDKDINQCISETLITTELPCLIPSWDDQNDNGTELENYLLNPCTPQPNGHCEFTYKLYYLDLHKFIQCDRSGNAKVKSCPASFTWDKDINQCLPEVLTTEQVSCLIPSGVNETHTVSSLPSFYPNPCMADMSRLCEFVFKPFLLDPHKFIQCDKLGKSSIRLCGHYFKWSQTMQRCVLAESTTIKPHCEIPTWVNENEPGSPLPTYYPNPCIADADRTCLFVYKPFLLDQNKFIVCSKNGDALVKTCPPNSAWIDNAGKCSIPDIQTTTKPECRVPAWVNQNEQGIPLKPFYPNPCPIDSNRKCEFIYLIYILDQHMFIQCDRSGKAVLKSCALNSIWDNNIRQCSIQTPIRPSCTVPIWVNPNEKGLPLPAYIPNPCKTTPMQTCKFFDYVINDSRFIECDQYGEAWVKTCPSFSKWNNIFKMCSKISNK